MLTNNLNFSAKDAVDVSPHDTNTITKTKGLYIGQAGDVNVRTAKGNDATFKSVPVGSILPVECDMVYNTGTSAAYILALYD